ncbi:MAG: PspC domain-containing protein [Parcubacteria group bacterium]|nr:PspC domain-containing protein [Parcubacteria group bacterium]
MKKKLYRSDKNKTLAGVIGGLGEYADVDAVFFRLLWVLITVFTGFFPGIIAYFVAIFIIPKEHEQKPMK